MKRYVTVRNGDGRSDMVMLTESSLPSDELLEEMRAAAADFLESGTEEVRTALDATGGKFGWTELAMWLPEHISVRRGFRILDFEPAGLSVDGSESLLPPKDN